MFYSDYWLKWLQGPEGGGLERTVSVIPVMRLF